MKKPDQSFPSQSWQTPGQLVAIVLVFIFLGVALTPFAGAQQNDSGCGNPFVNTYGPFDYLVTPNRKIVEDYHFTPQVESLVSGQSGTLGADIDYTLRVFPNHHRALISMMNLGAKLKNPQPTGAHFTVECYFKRALMFRPDDVISRMIYAKYLASNRRNREATTQLEYATRVAKEDAFTQYNAGLIYFEMGEFDKALLQAHGAYGLGFPRPDLKQKLQAAGKWVDPPPGEPSSAASSADPAVTSAAPAASASEPPR